MTMTGAIDNGFHALRVVFLAYGYVRRWGRIVLPFRCHAGSCDGFILQVYSVNPVVTYFCFAMGYTVDILVVGYRCDHAFYYLIIRQEIIQ
ncbi:hypothetical protein BDV41DRAFT_551104 [Aspergillus transmontanensis]|uniref:Uncharacterized protein n=1 Tax=Aspergillus transmontanensis TaxID=1034304 RepID=A0A5N6VJG5_9EURO|nr:hypothetical protein BDV41DRAFT_551104 [Aspergillus transmontanensis]